MGSEKWGWKNNLVVSVLVVVVINGVKRWFYSGILLLLFKVCENINVVVIGVLNSVLMVLVEVKIVYFIWLMCGNRWVLMVIVRVILMVMIGCFGFRLMLLVRLRINVMISSGSVEGGISVLISGL